MKNYRRTLNARSKQISRRDFIAGAAGGWAFTIVPRSVLGGAGYTPPSEKLNIAGIGVGGRGRSDISKVDSENIVALCDVDERRSWQTFKQYPNAKKYQDFRTMLDKQKNIDAVVVATPDHTHAVAAMTAIKMGKHVYCEKPLAHTIYETRKLTEAAREAGVATQMGNQGHSDESIRLYCEWIWDGAIGPVREVQAWTDRPTRGRPFAAGVGRPVGKFTVPQELNWDLWLGPAPYRPYHRLYLPFNWRGWFDFGCGALGDMGCHILDPAFWALKLRSPTSVEASSTEVNSETYPVASIVRYEFGARGDMPPVKLTWYDGGLKPERPEELEAGRKLPDSGSITIGDKGKIICGSHGASGVRLIPETKMREYTRPAKTLARSTAGHYQDWIEACKGGKPASSNFDYGGPLTEMVLLGCAAIRCGQKKLYWDCENMRFTNAAEANKYVHKEYREGWML